MGDYVGSSVAILTLSTIAGIFAIYSIRRQRLEVLSVSVLVVINYIVIQPISGIVHLLTPNAAVRGYYDLLHGPSENIFWSTLAAALGLAGLILGCLHPQKNTSVRKINYNKFWLSNYQTFILMIITIILAPIGIFAYIQVYAYVLHTGLARTIIVDSGVGRYAYISQWLVWVICFIVIMLAGTHKRPSQFTAAATAGAGVALIALILNWTGGRSYSLLFAYPLFLTMIPRFRAYQKRALLIGGGALAAYVIILTQMRLGSMQSSHGYSSLATFLDWEWGRFSMSGFALQYAEKKGHLWGETYLNSIAWTLGGILKLVGINAFSGEMRSASMIAGRDIIQLPVVYIVPGFTSEIILNFGITGVPILYYMLGRLCGKIDKKIEISRSALSRLSLSFVGSLLAFRAIPADATSIPSYLVYLGLPLFLSVWITNLISRSFGKTRSSIRMPASPAREASVGSNRKEHRPIRVSETQL